jgi:hypothetical protein
VTIDDDIKRELADAVNISTVTACATVTVRFSERYPFTGGWDITELQDAVNAACAGTDAWGYIVPLVNQHERQTLAIVISRRPR